jgi:AraC-like DNA-binding protein
VRPSATTDAASRTPTIRCASARRNRPSSTAFASSSLPTPGAAVMISRILDLMYIQMLRLWATSTQSSPGWLRAGMDPDIGGVLDAVHADPARAWSNAEMAQYAQLSRTTFTERFTRILGLPPMAYLTELRMELARELLLGSGETAKQVARRTGYKSDAAFNRAFARHHGRSPGQWRREHVPSDRRASGAALRNSSFVRCPDRRAALT